MLLLKRQDDVNLTLLPSNLSWTDLIPESTTWSRFKDALSDQTYFLQGLQSTIPRKVIEESMEPNLPELVNSLAG